MPRNDNEVDIIVSVDYWSFMRSIFDVLFDSPYPEGGEPPASANLSETLFSSSTLPYAVQVRFLEKSLRRGPNSMKEKMEIVVDRMMVRGCCGQRKMCFVLGANR